MKFKILKEVDEYGTWYWTIPGNIFLRIIDFLSDADSKYIRAYSCQTSLEKAKLHIKRYNNGYYTKRYYKKYIL